MLKLGAPTANYQWYWSGGRLYVYATQNPATQYAAIEAGARTVVEISEQSRAASACGKCRENLVHLLAVATEQVEEP